MLRKLCVCFLGIFLLIFAFAYESSAREQRNLNARTQLRPVNWSQHQKLWFAPGVYWIDSVEGGVQSGTLDQEADIKAWNSNMSYKFDKGFIRFERTGGVKEGTLARDTNMCVVNTASKTKLNLLFMGGQKVEFGYDGCVMRGTLAQQATLKTLDGKTNTYPKGTTVDFNGAGLVTRAQLPPGVAVGNIDGNYAGTCNLMGGLFDFRFTAKGGRFSGRIDKAGVDGYSLQWEGNYNNSGGISNGIITGFVHILQNGKWIRWTVRGPVTGIINPANSNGNASATTADGKNTRTGTWNAVKVGG